MGSCLASNKRSSIKNSSGIFMPLSMVRRMKTLRETRCLSVCVRVVWGLHSTGGEGETGKSCAALCSFNSVMVVQCVKCEEAAAQDYTASAPSLAQGLVQWWKYSLVSHRTRLHMLAKHHLVSFWKVMNAQMKIIPQDRGRMSYKVADVLSLHKQDKNYTYIYSQKKKNNHRVMFKIKYTDLH